MVDKIVTIELKIVDSATWKLKIINAMCKFLNWCTIPNSVRKRGNIVVNVIVTVKTELIR